MSKRKPKTLSEVVADIREDITKPAHILKALPGVDVAAFEEDLVRRTVLAMPLPGVSLSFAERPQTIGTPLGAHSQFYASSGWELSLDGATIHVRREGWHAGFSSVGCHWVFAL